MSSTTNKRPAVMTVDDVSQYLRVCRATVYRLAKRHKIPVGRVGKHLRFRREVIDEWLTNMERKNHDAH